MNRWKTYLLNDLDIAYFNKTIETVRAIQPDDLQKLANQYLQPEDFYELVVY
jgi:predicted Zn-dependent peptidase